MDSRQKRFISLSGVLASAVLPMFCGSTAQAATITLLAGDTFGQSSLDNSGGANHWSDGLAPSSGNAYVVPSGLTPRSPNGGTTLVPFLGDSLTFATGSTLSIKGGIGQELNFPNLILQGSTGGTRALINAQGSAGNWTLSGLITVTGGTTATDSASITGGGSSGTSTIAATITGTGALDYGVGTGTPVGGILVTKSNDYSGGTFINSSAKVIVNHDGGLGTGNVKLAGIATLTLTGGATNDYIGNSANLITFGSAGTVALNFTGVDTVAGVSLDGTTILTSGSFGAIGSGATTESSVFTGTGILSVPEPASLGLLTLGGVGLLARRQRKNRTA